MLGIRKALSRSEVAAPAARVARALAARLATSSPTHHRPRTFPPPPRASDHSAGRAQTAQAARRRLSGGASFPGGGIGTGNEPQDEPARTRDSALQVTLRRKAGDARGTGTAMRIHARVPCVIRGGHRACMQVRKFRQRIKKAEDARRRIRHEHAERTACSDRPAGRTPDAGADTSTQNEQPAATASPQESSPPSPPPPSPPTQDADERSPAERALEFGKMTVHAQRMRPCTHALARGKHAHTCAIRAFACVRACERAYIHASLVRACGARVCACVHGSA